MTRQDLYELVWSKPVTHIAKDYGVSDVAIKKHCKKHDIPTPPVGYWMKIAHGKKVRQPKLPTKDTPADAIVDLYPREPYRNHYEDQEGLPITEAERTALETACQVPEELPKKPLPVVVDLRRALREVHENTNGQRVIGDIYSPHITLGKEATDRFSILLFALASGAATRGHSFRYEEEHLCWSFEGESFRIYVKEPLRKEPHEPTARELKEQAERDEYRKRYPQDYYSDRKVYRIWDYFPSGRLSITIKDACGHGYRSATITRQWRDTSKHKVEDRLTDMILWAEAVTPALREKRLDLEAQARAAAEAEAERQRRRERRRRAERLEKRILEMARLVRSRADVLALLAYLETKADDEAWAIQWLQKEIAAYAIEVEKALNLGGIKKLLRELDIDEESPLLMTALSETGPEPDYGW
ncbi:hypothetical protein [Pseudohaliea sp.]|uniref:hypothetical protein n=1 Tax=Pseudohaliea sp. TaxID=2740289 RepID=UPI0032EFDE88